MAATTPAVLDSSSDATCRVLVVKRRPLSPSETFIETHLQRLGADTAFYAPDPPDGWRRRVEGALRRLHRDDVVQGWRTALRRFRPNVVLAEYGPTGVAVMRACERLGVPLVVYFHGYDATRRTTIERHRADYQKLFRSATTIIAASHGIAQQLRSLGAPEAKINYLPCGVDISRFTGARPHEAAPKVVAVGRLVDKKAPDLTIRAFDLARRQTPDAQLVLIGEGPMRQRCESLIEQLGLGEHVTMLGPQPHEIVLREMQSARLFAQHSVVAPDGDSEGTPVAIIEAQACGLPVVATRHGGIPDVVADRVSGFLVEEQDVEGMGRAMTALLADGDAARQMGENGRVRVTENFNETRAARTLLDVLAEASERGPRGSLWAASRRRLWTLGRITSPRSKQADRVRYVEKPQQTARDGSGAPHEENVNSHDRAEVPTPTFSVVIPTYNRATCLPRALDAVLAQTYPALEILVVDDGSTDDTIRVLQPYMQQYGVKLLHQHRRGGTAARNRGAAECNGDYITFLDSDDAVEPDWLQVLAALATGSTLPEVVSCGFQVFREGIGESLPVRSSRVLPASLWYAPTVVASFDHAGTFACRRDTFNDVGGFLTGLASGQLNEFGIRLTQYLAATGGRVVYADETPVRYFAERPDNIRGDLDAVISGSMQIMHLHERVFHSNRGVHAATCTVLGTRLIVAGRVPEGRRYLWRAAVRKPEHATTWLRLAVSFIPFLRNRAWGHLQR